MTLHETLEDVQRKYEGNIDYYRSNEAAVRTQLIEPVLAVLDWLPTDPARVRPNDKNEENKFPDYTLLKSDKIVMVIEAKKVSVDLHDTVVMVQLQKYCYLGSITVPYGVLTNGIKWIAFQTLGENVNERTIWEIDLTKDTIEDSKRCLSMLSFGNIEALESRINEDKNLNIAWHSRFPTQAEITKLVAKAFKKELQDRGHHFPDNKIQAFTQKVLFTQEETSIPTSHQELSPKTVTTISVKTEKESKREKIQVRFPKDNTVICQNQVIDTLVEVIEKIGIERIADLKILANSKSCTYLVEQNLLDSFERPRQRLVSGWYIWTNSNTQTKLEQLKEINTRLGLNLDIKVI